MMKAKLPLRYISTDWEATGPIPGLFSGLSFGACVVGETKLQCYIELKPLHLNCDPEALRIGALELDVLKNTQPKYNARSAAFHPRETLLYLQQHAEDPRQGVERIFSWLREVGEGYDLREAAAPIKFDGSFTAYYFWQFGGKNPLGHSGDDINSWYRGFMRNERAHIRDIERDRYGELIFNPRQHHALEDAIEQARKFEVVLEKCKV